jgi:nucleoside phosphorylase
MRILVTFAVDAEFAPWRKRHPFVASPMREGWGIVQEQNYKARIGGADVTVYLTGIGWRIPEGRFRELLGEKPDACISSGLAGGLKPDLKHGDVVAARFVRSRDEPTVVGANSRLVKVAGECGSKVVETCITSRQIVGQAQYKRAMGEFGDIVDMESFRIVSVVTGTKIPAVTVRAISDTVDEDMPLDFSQVLDGMGRVKTGQLTLQLARYPHKIPSLIRFGKESQRAGERLADFLDRYVEALMASKLDIPERREQVAAR